MTTTISPEALAFGTMPKSSTADRIEAPEHWHGLRSRDVTASVAGALLGVHPHVTPLALYNIKTGLEVDEVDTEPKLSEGDGWYSVSLPPAARGHVLEPVAMDLTRRRTGWRLSYPLSHYWRIPEARIGATPDAFAIDPERPGFGIVQFKTVAPSTFKESWVDPDTREIVPPDWVIVQALVEAKVTGASWAAVCVVCLSFTLEATIIRIPLHVGLWDRLRGEVAEFWRCVAAGEPPPPDWARDHDRIARLFGRGDGPQVDLSGDNELAAVLAERDRLKAIEASGNEAAKLRKVEDAKIIFRAGNAGSVLAPGGRMIEVKTVKRGSYTVAPTSYRTVKVSGAPSTRLGSPAHPESF